MSTQRAFGIITTIQKPTDCVRRLCARLAPLDVPLIVIGDKKGPWSYEVPGAELVTLKQQDNLPFMLRKILPENHYTRKNLGYLLAMKEGAQCIYETDDDNAPHASWRWREETTKACRTMVGGGGITYTATIPMTSFGHGDYPWIKMLRLSPISYCNAYPN